MVDEQDLLHELLSGALDGIFDKVEMAGAPVEYAVVWYPQGRAITQVNILASGDSRLERVAEALDVARMQLKR